MLRLKKVRLARGLSLQTVSYLVRIPVPTLSRLEAGLHPVYPRYREVLSALFAMAPSELFETVPDENKE